MGFSIFDSDSFLLKFTFLFDKKHGLFDFKASKFKFKNKKKRKPTHALAPVPLIFKLYRQTLFPNLATFFHKSQFFSIILQLFSTNRFAIFLYKSQLFSTTLQLFSTIFQFLFLQILQLNIATLSQLHY